MSDYIPAMPAKIIGSLETIRDIGRQSPDGQKSIISHVENVVIPCLDSVQQLTEVANFAKSNDLKKKAEIKLLNLSQNKITDEEVRMLAGSDLCNYVQCNILHANENENLTAEGLKLFPKILSNSGVKEFAMENCNLTEDKLRALRIGFGNAQTKIKMFDINGNKSMTPKSYLLIPSICEAAEVSCLMMEDCDLNHEKLREFSTGLEKHCNLDVIDLSNNESMGWAEHEILQSMEQRGLIKLVTLGDSNINSLYSLSKNMGKTNIKIDRFEINFGQFLGNTEIDQICDVLGKSNVEVLAITGLDSKNKLMKFVNGLNGKTLKIRILEISCEITDTYKLESLCTAFSRCKELNTLAFNGPLTEDTICLIPNIIRKLEIANLEMINSGFNKDKLKLFKDYAAKSGSKLKILNLSENQSMEEKSYSEITEICATLDVQLLQLESCNVDLDKLKVFYESVKNIGLKLPELDVSSNTLSAEATGVVQDIGREANIKALQIQECGLNDGELNKLKSTLKEAEVFDKDEVIKYCQDFSCRVEEGFQVQVVNIGQSKKPTTATEKLGAQSQDYCSGRSSRRSFKSSLRQRETLGRALISPPHHTAIPGAYTFGYFTDQRIDDKRQASVSTGKEIGPNGGAIEVAGCIITFPPSAFNKPTRVQAQALIDQSQKPDGYFPISPILDVKAEGLLLPAKVGMNAWCVSSDTQDSMDIVDVLHKSEGDSAWRVIKSIPLTDKTSIEFECRDFSKVLLAIKERLFGQQSYLIDTFIYANSDYNFVLAFGVHSPLTKTLIEKSLKENFIFQFSFNTIKVNNGKKLKLEILCTSCNQAKFQPNNCHEIIIDTDFATADLSKHNNIVLEGTDRNDIERFEFKLYKDDELKDSNLFNWNPLEGIPKKPEYRIERYVDMKFGNVQAETVVGYKEEKGLDTKTLLDDQESEGHARTKCCCCLQ